MLEVKNITRDTVVIHGGRVANNYWSRLRGLIGVRQLRAGDGLAIFPCNGVHCMFMSIPIDVIYVTADHRVDSVDHEMQPWTVGRPRRGVHYVIEVPAGTARRTATQAGDQLEVRF